MAPIIYQGHEAYLTLKERDDSDEGRGSLTLNTLVEASLSVIAKYAESQGWQNTKNRLEQTKSHALENSRYHYSLRPTPRATQLQLVRTYPVGRVDTGEHVAQIASAVELLILRVGSDKDRQRCSHLSRDLINLARKRYSYIPRRSL